ncbi:S-layer homology domain-containing protein [Cohnella herbarum]|uniref:DUF5011 domain-containing protein n=1 Tax=Cohnella herbarum TaxID=2728023 RepID=A0A7Z2VQI5_9BACL|nr:S-layer homology domain-containing protein [Cohnella herbarum]QJD87384.1 DUF5011 domain-containing protein [Cohnella herbarum]
MKRMRKRTGRSIPLLLLAALLLAVAIPTGFANAQSSELSDIEGHWAEADISEWYEAGLVKGYSDGSFRPDDGITRSEFAALVNRSFQLTEPAAISFKDVKESAWYYKEIAIASKAGYLNGYSDGTAKPIANISREEAAAIVSRLASLEKDEEEASQLADFTAFSGWSKGYIGAVAKAGFIKGYSDGSFKPKQSITRAETVFALKSALKAKAPKEKVTIEAIKEQSVIVNFTTKVAVKTKPEDAKVTVKSSDDKVATATVNGPNIEVKGLKSGAVKITVTAKKDGYADGQLTFDVKVNYGGGGGGPGPTPTPTPNQRPVITVDERDESNDGWIKLKVGDKFTPPVVTAVDAEDGNITSKIVKTGENLVDTSKVGEYVLKYNVTDSRNLAAAERIVRVKVEAPAPNVVKADIEVDVAEDLPTFKEITVHSADVGSKFKVEGSTLVKSFKESITLNTAAATLKVTILDNEGKELGFVIVDVAGDNRKNYTLQVENQKPVITVVEPDGKNDGVITIRVGGAFQAPAVTANDPEDGDITSRIVKTGENLVDTSKVGDYVLTYNVSDSRGLAAAERKVTVKVIAANSATVNITVDVAEELPTLKNIKVDSATVGAKFKVEGSALVKPFGESIALNAGATTLKVTILDTNGNEIGFVMADVNGDNSKAYTFEYVGEEPGESEQTATIKVEVAKDLPTFKNITVKSSTVGAKFRVEGSDLVKPFGESITLVTGQAALIVTILDADANELGSVNADVANDNQKDYVFKAPNPEPASLTANVTVDVAEDLPTLKNITVNSASAGVKFKVEGSSLTKGFGESIALNTGSSTRIVSILGASGNVINSFTIDVSADRTQDYDA